MTANETASDPVSVLVTCLSRRSERSMVASLRDVWFMAQRLGFQGTYQDAGRLLVDAGFLVFGDRDRPMMIRPSCQDGIRNTVRNS